MTCVCHTFHAGVCDFQVACEVGMAGAFTPDAVRVHVQDRDVAGDSSRAARLHVIQDTFGTSNVAKVPCHTPSNAHAPVLG